MYVTRISRYIQRSVLSAVVLERITRGYGGPPLFTPKLLYFNKINIGSWACLRRAEALCYQAKVYYSVTEEIIKNN
jgi:hypothetical protein